MVKATWSRDLTMALGLSRLGRGRGESVGSVFLTWGLLPLIRALVVLLIVFVSPISSQINKAQDSRSKLKFGGACISRGSRCDFPLGSRAWNGRWFKRWCPAVERAWKLDCQIKLPLSSWVGRQNKGIDPKYWKLVINARRRGLGMKDRKQSMGMERSKLGRASMDKLRQINSN